MVVILFLGDNSRNYNGQQFALLARTHVKWIQVYRPHNRVSLVSLFVDKGVRYIISLAWSTCNEGSHVTISFTITVEYNIYYRNK